MKMLGNSNPVDSDDLQASALMQDSQDEEIPAVLTEEYPPVQSLPSIAEDGSDSKVEGNITPAVESKHKKKSPLVPLVLFLAVFGVAATVGITLGLEKRDESRSDTENTTSYLRPKTNTTDTVKDVEKIDGELEVSPSEYAAGLLEALEEENKAINETTGPKSSKSAKPQPPPSTEEVEDITMSMPINIVSHELTTDEAEVTNVPKSSKSAKPESPPSIEEVEDITMSIPINIVSHELTTDEAEVTNVPKSSKSAKPEPPPSIEEEVTNVKEESDNLIAMSLPLKNEPYGEDGPQFGRRHHL